MVDPSTKHNRLPGPTKYLQGLLYPLVDNVPGDLHPPTLNLISRPLPSHLLGPGHINLFGNVDLQRGQPLLLHKTTRSGPGHDSVVDLPQSLGKWGGRQANDLHVWVGLDVFDGLFPGDMTLVHDQ